MFGRKRKKFELYCVNFINSITSEALTKNAAKLPHHFHADFVKQHTAGKLIHGRNWPTVEHSEGIFLEMAKEKMYWLIKHNDAVFDENIGKAMKIQIDHLAGRQKLFVHELLELFYVFGSSALQKVPNDIPSHFENRVASLSEVQMPFGEDSSLPLVEWVKLPSEVKLHSLQ